MRKIFFVLTCALFLSAADTAEETANEIAERFMAKIASGDTSEAVDAYLEPTVKKLMGSNLPTTVITIDGFATKFGGIKDYTILHDEVLSPRFKRIVYIAHTPTIPLSFEIFVYKGEKGWIVSSFQFETDMGNIFPALR